MEIKLLLANHYHNSKFKIDFIVWKYESEGCIYLNAYQFKIDFIVWKYFLIDYDIVRVNLFKIDFIVWKFPQRIWQFLTMAGLKQTLQYGNW